jgi:hypothetical protein
MPADKTIVPDAVKSASILATEANAVKAKLAAAEYEIKALYEHIAIRHTMSALPPSLASSLVPSSGSLCSE